MAKRSRGGGRLLGGRGRWSTVGWLSVRSACSLFSVRSKGAAGPRRPLGGVFKCRGCELRKGGEGKEMPGKTGCRCSVACPTARLSSPVCALVPRQVKKLASVSAPGEQLFALGGGSMTSILEVSGAVGLAIERLVLTRGTATSLASALLVHSGALVSLTSCIVSVNTGQQAPPSPTPAFLPSCPRLGLYRCCDRSLSWTGLPVVDLMHHSLLLAPSRWLPRPLAHRLSPASPPFRRAQAPPPLSSPTAQASSCATRRSLATGAPIRWRGRRWAER